MKRLQQRYRYSVILLRQLVKTDFKLRYQGSFLGYLWTLLRPLAFFTILYFVFTRVFELGDSIPHYPVYLLLGIVLWNYFVEVTTGSVSAIVGKGDLLRKINFPKYVIILAGSFSALINLMFNFVIVAILLIINHVDIRATILLLPLFILELFVLSVAAAFFLSAAYVRFRDVNYIWEVFIQGAFYATPIIYPLATIPGKVVISPDIAKLLLLNPLAQIIQDARWALVTDKTVTINQLYSTHLIRLVPVGITLITVVLAATYFRKRSRYFAEEI